MERVFSGIQPTGDIHLGNALGAVRHWVDEQHARDSMFCVVDLHAMTHRYDPTILAQRSRETAMLLMAWGLEPDSCVLFVQSSVREHTELAWLLNCVATTGELGRMTQYKDKSLKLRDSSSLGLFAYPVLMAADILLYDTNRVPVGADQRQHLELARNIAQRANQRFGEVFVVPEAQIATEGARIMDLAEPTRKMSKSMESPNGTVNVLDDPKVIAKRIRSAVTDSEAEIRFDPDQKPGIANLLSIVAAIRQVPIAAVAESFTGQQYGALKQAVADEVVEYLAPVQSRFSALADDPAEVDRRLLLGTERARDRAAIVMERVRERFGYR